MKLTSLVSGGAAVLVGSFGAFAGYQSVMGEPTWLNTAAEESVEVPEPVAPTPRVKIKLRDCPQGFAQVKQECVRTVERTVTVPVEVVVPPAAPAPVYVGDDNDGDDNGGDRDRDGRDDDRGGRGDDRDDDDRDDRDDDDRDDRDDDDRDDDHDDDHDDDDNDNDEREFEND